MNRELAYRCQMLPRNIRESRTLAHAALAKTGWRIADLETDLDAALSWARSHCLVQQQEKARKTRARRKETMRGDDALDAMFASAGADPAEIPRKAVGNAPGHIGASVERGEPAMGLGLSTGGGGGDIKPYVNYDAKAGRMFRVDRVQQSDGSYATDKVEITNAVQFVADLANIRVGWVNYTSQGPIRKFVTLGKEAIPPRPDDKNADGKPAFKQGFEIDLILNKEAGGPPPRVFGSAAGCVIEAMDALHDAYTAAPESKSGKLPVVKISGVSPVKSGQSTNYKPTFAIVNWIDRPVSLVAQAASPSTAPSGAPSTGSTVVSAPQPAQTADASDFG